MLHLAIRIYAVTATIFAGTGVIAMVMVAAVDPLDIAAAFAIGVLVALPVAWLVARNIHQSLNGPRVS